MDENKWMERYYMVGTIVSVLSVIITLGYFIWVFAEEKLERHLTRIKTKANVMKVSFKEFFGK